MRFLFLFFGLCAFASAGIFNHSKKTEISPDDQAKKLNEMSDAILKASDAARDGHLSEASKKADEASQITDTLVQLKAPGIKRANADAHKAAAKEVEKAAAANDKLVVERAISSMEYELEKILENLDTIKQAEEPESKKVAPTEIAEVLILEDPIAVTDLEATAKQIVDADPTIPEAKKQKAVNHTVKAAKEGFKEAGTTNAKLVKLSKHEEHLVAKPPKKPGFHLFGFGKKTKCGEEHPFKWEGCNHNFGFRFCRRVFFRRYFQRRGYHHVFYDEDE